MRHVAHPGRTKQLPLARATAVSPKSCRQGQANWRSGGPTYLWDLSLDERLNVDTSRPWQGRKRPCDNRMPEIKPWTSQSRRARVTREVFVAGRAKGPPVILAGVPFTVTSHPKPGGRGFAVTGRRPKRDTTNRPAHAGPSDSRYHGWRGLRYATSSVITSLQNLG